MTIDTLLHFAAVRVALLAVGALFIGYCLSLDWFAKLAWFVVRTLYAAVRRGVWRSRHQRRRVKRRPIRSTRRDAKRAAHRYAKELAGRDLSWKKARKMLNRLDRDARAAAAPTLGVSR